MVKRYNHLSFEELLQAISIKSLSCEYDVDGRYYVLHTHNYGSSPRYKTIGELRIWVERELGWQVDANFRNCSKIKAIDLK